jgi:hypothetical protein
LKASVGSRTSSFTIPLLFSCNSLLARILERDKAENLGPSGSLLATAFGVSVETATSELLISTFGSSISAFCELVAEDCVLLSKTCLASTIE